MAQFDVLQFTYIKLYVTKINTHNNIFIKFKHVKIKNNLIGLQSIPLDKSNLIDIYFSY